LMSLIYCIKFFNLFAEIHVSKDAGINIKKLTPSALFCAAKQEGVDIVKRQKLKIYT